MLETKKTNIVFSFETQEKINKRILALSVFSGFLPILALVRSTVPDEEVALSDSDISAVFL